MTGRELISIIVPIYNIDKYVEKCICSIVNQSYRNIEIILIDDGSTDKSGDICDSMAMRDNRISVIHKENGGLSDARNRGLEESRGEIISFVDGDDWIHPQMLELMTNIMIKKQADIVTCVFSRDENDMKKQYDISSVYEDLLSGIEAFKHPEKVLASSCCKLYKRFIFGNIRYPKNKYHEDEFVFHRMLYNANSVAVIDIPLYFYSVRDGSITSHMSHKRLNDGMEAFEDRVSFTQDVNWREAIPIAISQYCDRCINEYFNLKNGKYPELEASYKDRFLRCERDILLHNSNVKIWRGYKIFAKSPTFYCVWLKFRKRLGRYKRNILKIIFES